MQDALKQNSVFSKRNFVVNGLVLIGSAAGGFAFIGPTGFSQGVTVYTSNFIPALQKFWPDRRIDQQSNLLKYGFQDKMVIAKEDPGKTYAFFPIERLLTRGLAKIYRDDPALFLNMAELYLDPGAKNHDLINLRRIVDGMILPKIDAPPLACQKEGTPCIETAELKSRVLYDIFSPCYLGERSTVNPNGEPSCTLSPYLTPTELKEPQLTEIRAVKDIMSGLSLNTVRVVVSGIMTINVDLIPAVLTQVQFDDPASGGMSIWEDTVSQHTGVIYGKYLSNGKPSISAIKVPSDSGAKLEDYVDTTSLAAVQDKSTDSELHFVVKFKKVIPSGTTLTFQVTKTSSKATNNTQVANTQETTSSMGLDVSVTYTPSPQAPPPAPAASPAITEVVFDLPKDLLKAGQTTGHLSGTNLDGASIGIKSILLADGKSADLKTYVSDGFPKDAPGSSATQINFTFSLKKALPASSQIILDVTQKSADGSSRNIESKPYTIPAG